MNLLVFVFFVFAVARLTRSDYETDELRTCEFDRAEIGDCMQLVADANGNGKISKGEILTVEHDLLTWLENWLTVLFSISHIMEHCDYDRDGEISAEDFDNSVQTCLAECSKLELINNKICKRAKDQGYTAAKAKKQRISEAKKNKHKQ